MCVQAAALEHSQQAVLLAALPEQLQAVIGIQQAALQDTISVTATIAENVFIHHQLVVADIVWYIQVFLVEILIPIMQTLHIVLRVIQGAAQLVRGFGQQAEQGNAHVSKCQCAKVTDMQPKQPAVVASVILIGMC